MSQQSVKELIDNFPLGHSHWDHTMRYGAGCELCIRQYAWKNELKEQFALFSKLKEDIDCQASSTEAKEAVASSAMSKIHSAVIETCDTVRAQGFFSQEKRDLLLQYSEDLYLMGLRDAGKTDVVASPAMSAASVYEVHPDAPPPSCHACGAMMIPTEWKCSSCGTTISPSAAPPAGMTAAELFSLDANARLMESHKHSIVGLMEAYTAHLRAEVARLTRELEHYKAQCRKGGYDLPS